MTRRLFPRNFIIKDLASAARGTINDPAITF